MNRTTIMLPDQLRTRAVRRARDRGISFGEFVREALRAALQEGADKVREADTLYADKAVFAGEAPDDVSLNHDRYLYGDAE